MVCKINKYLNIYQWSFLLLTIISPLIVKCESDPDEFVPPLIYIQSRGYTGESHYITTDDGYILQVHRIISPKYLNVPRKAVLLQHGLLLSGMVFIINSPGGGDYFHGPVENHDPVNHYRSRHPEIGNNLGFLLADHGYDVWLANSRGNTYSTNHTKLSPFQDKKYWEFSFDEMALYDLPAVISHIQYVTGQKEIAYIGHSQGTAIAFVLLSERPQYASILKPVILLAPIMNISTTKDALKHVLTDEELMKDLLKVGGPLLPHASLLELFPEVVCATKLLYICENVLQIMGGLNVAQLNVTRLPVYFSYIPAGTSAKNFVHYKQMVLKGARYFDHGPEKNVAMYGRSEPPEFHFDRLDTSNMVMFWSENDLFCGAEEMDAVRRTLRRPPMAEYRIPDPLWSHMDFLFGRQAGRFVNGPILGILKRYPISWLPGRGPQNHGSFSGHSNIPTHKPGPLINKPKYSRPHQPSLNG